MYSVFGDESHDETASRVYSVTGIFGSQDEWNSIAGPWLALNKGAVFHATDCESNKGQYFSKSDPENKKLYRKLIELVCESPLMGRSHTADLLGWNTYFPKQDPETMYCLGFRNVLQECGNLAYFSIPQGPLEVTFDSRIETTFHARSLYDYMKGWDDWSAHGVLQDKISFVSRKSIGIQVADLVCREAMKHLDNQVGPVTRRTRLSMRALQSTGRFRFTYYNRDWFKDARDNFPALSKRFGYDDGEYRQWLSDSKLVDGMTAKHKFMFEKFPTGPKMNA